MRFIARLYHCIAALCIKRCKLFTQHGFGADGRARLHLGSFGRLGVASVADRAAALGRRREDPRGAGYGVALRRPHAQLSFPGQEEPVVPRRDPLLRRGRGVARALRWHGGLSLPKRRPPSATRPCYIYLKPCKKL